MKIKFFIFCLLATSKTFAQNAFIHKELWSMEPVGKVRVQTNPNIKISTNEFLNNFYQSITTSPIAALVTEKRADGFHYTEFSEHLDVQRTIEVNNKDQVMAISHCERGGCFSLTPDLCHEIESKLNNLNKEEINKCMSVMGEVANVYEKIQAWDLSKQKDNLINAYNIMKSKTGLKVSPPNLQIKEVTSLGVVTQLNKTMYLYNQCQTYRNHFKWSYKTNDVETLNFQKNEINKN